MPISSHALDLKVPLIRPSRFKERGLLLPLTAEIKEDGWWTRITNLGGGLRVHGQRIHDGKYRYHEIPEDIIRKCWVKLPPETVVDGELFIRNGFSTDVPHYLATEPWRLHFCAFSMPIFRGKDLTHCYYAPGRNLLAGILGLQIVTELETFYDLPTRSEVLALLNGQWSGEGIVLKHGWYYGWWKVKPVETADVVIIGLKDGKGKYEGMVGSLILGLEGQPIGKCSGMNDETREAITDADIGRVVEVHYDRLTSKGKLRFARFEGWRDDKSPEQCTLTQLE